MEHQRFAESKGIKTVSIYNGLFLENPWGFADIWHGLDKKKRVWYVAGTGEEAVTLTSKLDVARCIVRVCELLVSNPDRVPNTLRIKGNDLTPTQIIVILNKVLQRNRKQSDWRIEPLLSETAIQARMDSQACEPEDAAELALLGPDFDSVSEP